RGGQRGLAFGLQPPEPLAWKPVDDHLGWHEQGDGRLYVGIYIENGRIADVGDVGSRSGLRAKFEELGPQVRLPAQQNVILPTLEPAQRPRVEELMAEYGMAPVESIPAAIR